MRFIMALAAALVVIVAVWGSSTPPTAEAAFHCMRIHAVMYGFNTDNNIQYVELRMNTGGQTLVSGQKLRFFDSAGTLKAEFTFPANVTNGSTGDSILIATSEFNAAATGGTANFVFSGANTVGSNGGDPLHPVQGPNGKVRFAPGTDSCDGNFTVDPGDVDSVAYGTATADWTAAAAALPSPSDNRALRLNNLAFDPVNNSTEYALNPVSAATFSVAPANLATDMATPRNNGRTVLRLGPPPTVGGVSTDPAVRETSPLAASDDGGTEMTLWIALAALALTGTAGATGALVWIRRRD